LPYNNKNLRFKAKYMIISNLEEKALLELANAESYYEGWLAAKREVSGGTLRWKSVNNTDYLVRLRNSKGDGSSLGPRSDKTEAIYQSYQAAILREKDHWNKLHILGGFLKQLKVGLIPESAGNILRQLDIDRALGTKVFLVGTNAMSAYALEAGVRLSPDIMATDDLDITRLPKTPSLDLLDTVKKVDNTFVVNTEKTFQVRNQKGYEVEVIAGSGDSFLSDYLKPVVLKGQEWLLLGRPIERVGFDTGLRPVRMIVPDPRLYALHKLWLSKSPDRNPLKKNKDKNQALDLIDMVKRFMPHYPFDQDFIAILPKDLQKIAKDVGLESNVQAPNKKFSQ